MVKITVSYFKSVITIMTTTVLSELLWGSLSELWLYPDWKQFHRPRLLAVERFNNRWRIDLQAVKVKRNATNHAKLLSLTAGSNNTA